MKKLINDKKANIVSLLIGLVIGYKAMPVMMHFIYLSIISSLTLCLLFKFGVLNVIGG
jgi:hypothetical protein